MKIKDLKTALGIFKESSIKQAEATEKGDYKTGNKCYDRITKAANYLKKENAISSLKEFLSSDFVGVRLWAAYYWLSVDENEGTRVLEEIAKSTDIHSLSAETTLSEWKKGNLKF